MYYDNLPIFKSALDLVVYVETILKGFDKYNKYTRVKICVSKEILTLVDDFVLFSESKEALMGHYVQRVKYLEEELELELRQKYILRENKEGLDFLGYIIRPHYTLVRKSVVHNYKQKKAQYLERYDVLQGTMKLSEIKQFLSVKASFVCHAKHANSYNLPNKAGEPHETNPFDTTRA